MKKIVVIPLGRVEDYIKTGKTYQYFESTFNPGNYFDEVYCLSDGEEQYQVGKVRYISAKPVDFGEIISKIKPDLVRVYAGFGPCDWAVANHVKDIPVVVSVHDKSPNLINQSLKYADYVICKSQVVKEAVSSYVEGIDENRIHIVPNSINTRLFSKKENKEFFTKLNRKYGDGKHVLHVGRKVVEKNLDTLIKAVQFLPPEYKVIFLGAGNAEEYERLAKQCNVAERCFFVDHVSYDELPWYYSWCDCMCTPSRTEGFGYVFIEAAACECSIVTSDIAPMNEYLSDGVDSLLVEEYENPKILARQIIVASKNDDTVQRMRKNAREVGLKFSKANIDKQEIALYEKLMNKGTDNRQFRELEKERKKIERRIIIFGAGKVGKNLLNCVGKDKIAYFVDSDSQKLGKKIDGIEIIGYADLLKIHREYNVVVTPVDRKEIVKRLIADGIEYMEVKWYLFLKEQIDKEFDTNLGKE